MVGQKFFVYGGGRWREINISTGRVAGWGVVEYLSVRGGRLELTQRNAVLRGFKALAAGKPTSVHDGPRLSQIRNIKTKNVEEPKPTNNECLHHQQCCQHIIHSNTDANFNNIVKPITSTIAVQCTITNENISHKVIESTINDNLNHSIIKKTNCTNNIKDKSKEISIERTKKNKRSSSESDIFNTTDSQNTNSDGKLATSLAQRGKSSKTQEPPKELLISEEDILLIRTFVEHDEDNVFGVDLERFDSDDLYKCLVFYKLNPLVNVERSKEITELVKKKSRSMESFKDFLKNLGLQSVDEASQVSSSKYRLRARRKIRVKNTTYKNEFDKENVVKDVICKKSKRSSGVLGERISQVVLRDMKSGKKLLSSTGLVKGSKSRPLSKNDLTNQNHLEKNKNAIITNKNEKTNESPNKIEKMKENYLKNNNEQAKKNDSLRQNDSLKKRKEKNENELMKQKETEKQNKTTDKNNKEKIVDQQKVSDKVVSNELNNKESQNDSDSVLVSSDSDKQSDKRNKTKMPRLAVVTAKRLYIRGDSTRQPYTSAEDLVMVQWVRGPGRARQVNGNNLWRELQPIFHKKTGRFRSWHSLRNRYLRSLLPSLGNMAIPPDEAARLRAAAAAGELKSKKMLKNSIYKEKRVISAWSRRPRSPLRKSPTPSHSTGFLNSSSDRSRKNHDSDYTAESRESEEPRMYKKIDSKIDKSKRTLRSSVIETSPKEKRKETKARTPTYSELTKKFALKHSTPDSDSARYNTDKNVRPLRLLRRHRQNAESSVIDTTKDNNSKHNKNNIFKSNKKRKRKFSSDREDHDDRNDKNNVNGVSGAGVNLQNSKNNKHLNNSKRHARQISTDRTDTDTNNGQTKSGRQNSKNISASNLSIIRRSTRKSLIDRQDTDSSNDQRNEKRLSNYEQNSKSIKNNDLKNKKSVSNVSTNEDTDTSDNQTKSKKLTSINNTINKSRRSKRNISSEQQETDTEDQVKSKRLLSTNAQNSKTSKTNLNYSRKRARKSSTEEEDIDISTSDDEKQSKPINKTINLNKSPNKTSKNLQNTSNDKINQKSKKIRKSDRHNDTNSLINKNRENNINNSNKISNGRHDSSDSSDFEPDMSQVKKLRSSNAKTDTGRSKARRLFNPKDF